LARTSCYRAPGICGDAARRPAGRDQEIPDQGSAQTLPADLEQVYRLADGRSNI